MGENERRIERLEELVAVLAQGILLHEYSKDLCRFGVEAACREMAQGKLEEALKISRGDVD